MDLEIPLKIKRTLFDQKHLNDTPEEPGIYIFWSKNTPLYIGKSVNLKRRLKSYKSLGLIGKTAILVSQIKSFSYIIVFSEIEALLLEAKLVNLFKPPYNILLKDDKHPLYIRITNDKYPMVLTARKNDNNTNDLDFFGPYPSTANVKKTLNIIRNIFPFSQHLPSKRACFYHQIGLCDPCPSNIEKIKSLTEYKKTKNLYMNNIRYIRYFLNGKINTIESNLYKKMNYYTKLERFEEANKVKSQINAIKYVTSKSIPSSYFIKNPNFAEDLKLVETQQLMQLLSTYIHLKKLERIECYDVAHLGGTYPTASMVTFINGSPEKNLYRHFKIRQKNTLDDVSNLAEIARRRVNHFKDWGKPDLIIVDGGKGQVGAFLKHFKNTNIPVIGLAKRNENLIIPDAKNNIFLTINIRKAPELYLLQRIRDEAHRFSRRLHHKLVSENLLHHS